MKTIILGLTGLFCFITSSGQKLCSTQAYLQDQIANDVSFNAKQLEIEQFIQRNLQTAVTQSSGNARSQALVIRIPVVVHIIYHYPHENINDLQVQSQIEALNRDFRKRNADSVKIPAAFRAAYADCEIEFELAKVDAKGRATTGIVRKYSPIKEWKMDDKVKFSSEMGSDAWDAKSYLNVWVCNLYRLDGYSSAPGGPADKDGIVVNTSMFGTGYAASANSLGRTAVHEIGHWLGLKHIWGDEDCGEDGVSDTPKQRTYTINCPEGVRMSCGSDANGDMYMNYMDFTNDACIQMFTAGQKQRMRSLFVNGGVRNSLLYSKGLGTPLIEEMPIPDNPPKWLQVKSYPNPTTDYFIINLEYDARWIGKQIQVTNAMGQVVLTETISSVQHKINVSHLRPGIYYVRADRENDRIREKLVKL